MPNYYESSVTDSDFGFEVPIQCLDCPVYKSTMVRLNQMLDTHMRLGVEDISYPKGIDTIHIALDKLQMNSSTPEKILLLRKNTESWLTPGCPGPKRERRFIKENWFRIFKKVAYCHNPNGEYPSNS